MWGVVETISWRRARLLVAMGAIAVALAAAPTGLAQPLRPPTSDFSRYRLDPPAGVIYPKAVASADPGVSDASAVLTANDGRSARIQRTPAGDPVLLLDFGRNVSGVVEVGFTDASGAGVALMPAERLKYLVPPPYFPGTGDVQGDAAGSDDPSDRAPTARPPAGTRSTYATPGVLGAERWLAIRLTEPGSVSVDYVRIRYSPYRPGPNGYKGWFLSSDDQLNRIWFASAYTEQLIHRTNPEMLLDGAKRDRLVWIGDLTVSGPTEMLTTARSRALRNSLELIAGKQRPDGYLPANADPRGQPSRFEDLTFASYVALWPVALDQYYRFTADRGFVRAMLPTMRRAMDWLAQRVDRSDGLFQTSPAEANDWHPPDQPAGKVADTNTNYYSALRAAAELERAAGDPKRAAPFERQARTLRASFNAKFWDQAAGMYRLSHADANFPGDANVDAIVTGLAGGRNARRVLAGIRRRLWTRLGPATIEQSDDPAMTRYISPFVAGLELIARATNGDVQGAVDLTRRTWGYFLRADPASTMWEKLDVNGEPATYNPDGRGNDVFPAQGIFQRGFSSLAQGWSTGPIEFLTGYVLGVRLSAPGYARFVFAPSPAKRMRWARGVVPTPHGAIAAWWRATARRFTASLRVPHGERATVLLPARRVVSLRVDGRTAWRRRGGDGRSGPRVRRAGSRLRVTGLAAGRPHVLIVTRGPRIRAAPGEPSPFVRQTSTTQAAVGASVHAGFEGYREFAPPFWRPPELAAMSRSSPPPPAANPWTNRGSLTSAAAFRRSSTDGS
jgi:alpha-L-rhamnosidase